MKKAICLFLAIVFSLTVLTSCKSNVPEKVAITTVESASEATIDNSDAHEIIDNRTSTEQIENTDINTTKAQQPTNDDFEVTGHLYSTKYASYYYLIVKNNSGYDVEVSGNAIAKDASGNAIGAGSMEIDVIGPNQTSIGYFYFNDVDAISDVEYNLSYKTDLYYQDVLSSLAVQETVNNKNVIVSVTNNGSVPAEFVEAYALFFDANGQIVDTSFTYITDSDSEIKPGATLAEQLSIYDAFDHVEVYLTGRAQKR